jgi:hypothetical protein
LPNIEFPAQKIKIFFELSIQLFIKFEISLNKKLFFFKNLSLFSKFDLKNRNARV